MDLTFYSHFMKTPVIIRIGIVFLFFISCNSDSNKVYIKLFAPNLADTTKVYITGDIDQFGRWQPDKTPMKNQGHHLWKIAFIPKLNASIEYKFTLGSWEKEGLTKDNNPLPNFAINTQDTKNKTDTVYNWGHHVNKIKGQITGTVKYHKQMKGDGLLKRDVIVWLPPNYDKDTSKRYAVLYMHDGQNIIDPKTSSFGVDWQVDESCDSLIKLGKIPPIIIVGMNSTTDRSLDYAPGTKGTAYMNFIIDKVKPMIDSIYRTNPDRRHTFVGGSSMGGLISMMLVWEHSDIFSATICMSPAFQYKNFDYIHKITSYNGPKKDIKIYLDLGTVGLETQLEPGVNAMVKALKTQGYLKNKDYFYLKENKARHFEADWARRFPKALTFILNN